MSNVKPKNPCYECKIHIAGVHKKSNKECQVCKNRFAYADSIYDTDYLTNIDYNYMDNHVVHTS